MLQVGQRAGVGLVEHVMRWECVKFVCPLRRYECNLFNLFCDVDLNTGGVDN